VAKVEKIRHVPLLIWILVANPIICGCAGHNLPGQKDKAPKGGPSAAHKAKEVRSGEQQVSERSHIVKPLSALSRDPRASEKRCIPGAEEESGDEEEFVDPCDEIYLRMGLDLRERYKSYRDFLKNVADWRSEWRTEHKGWIRIEGTVVEYYFWKYKDLATREPVLDGPFLVFKFKKDVREIEPSRFEPKSTAGPCQLTDRCAFEVMKYLRDGVPIMAGFFKDGRRVWPWISFDEAGNIQDVFDPSKFPYTPNWCDYKIDELKLLEPVRKAIADWWCFVEKAKLQQEKTGKKSGGEKRRKRE